MHPSISKFPSSRFYGAELHDAPNMDVHRCALARRTSAVPRRNALDRVVATRNKPYNTACNTAAWRRVVATRNKPYNAACNTAAWRRAADFHADWRLQPYVFFDLPRAKESTAGRCSRSP
jgi:hypothetical protein